MKALFLLADGFEDLQFFYPWYRLQEEGIQVTLGSTSSQPLTGLHQYRTEPDMPIPEINPSEYDLLVIHYAERKAVIHPGSLIELRLSANQGFSIFIGILIYNI